MTMKNLAELQVEAKELLGNELKHPRLGATLGLVEELGELVKEVMEVEIYGTGPTNEKWPEQKAAFEAEVGDILFSLFEVCNAYDISLEAAYQSKFSKIAAKREDWLQKYADGLKKRRIQLD